MHQCPNYPEKQLEELRETFPLPNCEKCEFTRFEGGTYYCEKIIEEQEVR